MYHEYFGLKQAPFRITPDTRFFYTGARRGEILEAVVYAITSGEGVIKVVGEVGSGKTMLCRMLESRLPEHVEIVYLANPSVAPDEILNAIAVEMDLAVAPNASRLQVMHALHRRLLEKYAGGRRVVVFVEEAQSMPVATLEEIRLLSNLETQQDKLLQIVLFGQPELDVTLDSPDIRQLKERITHSFYLPPFDAGEIGRYVNFRMRAAGYRGPHIFSKAAYQRIARSSEGLIRRVNILADKALLAAFAEGSHSVEPRHVETAVRDSEFGSRAGRRRVPELAVGVGVVVVLAGVGWAAVERGALQRVSALWLGPTQAVAERAAAPAGSPESAQPADAPSTQAAADASPARGAADGGAAVAARTAGGSPATGQGPQASSGVPEGVPEKPAAAPEAGAPGTGAEGGGGAGPREALASATADSAEDVNLAMVSAPFASEAEPAVGSGPAEAGAGTRDGLGPQRVDGGGEPRPQAAGGAGASAPPRDPPPADRAAVGPEEPLAREASEPADADASRTVAAAGESAGAGPQRVDEGEGGLIETRMRATRAWLAAAPRNHYSIQLLMTSAGQRRQLEEFLRARQRARELDAVYVYQTRIGGALWFGVLYGEYPSAERARQALRELAPGVKRDDSFIRQVRNISTSG